MSVVRRAMMKAALRSLAMCVGLCLTGLAIASPVAFAEGSSALGGTGGSSLGSPLVIPGSPTARRTAVQARGRSDRRAAKPWKRWSSAKRPGRSSRA